MTDSSSHTDIAIWGIASGAAATVLGYFTFGLRLFNRITKAEMGASIAQEAAKTANARIDVYGRDLAEHKVSIAGLLAEMRTTGQNSIKAIDELGRRFDRMADRLDELLKDESRHRRSHPER